MFFLPSEHYLASVTWVTDERVAVQWLKRLQNDLILQIYSLAGHAWDPVEVPYFKYDESLHTRCESNLYKGLLALTLTAKFS